ncbi:Taurine--pyruvate aminotransferase [compost metagenome]|uniref:aminotransferase class III-fold pyridoxal phosphate-dependent enzyme n=1 Tax=Acinetobacter sp. AC1-2 TaxID=2735132 RepID=UPI000FA7C862|nr:aminotransferase class III-fold pyridoxal phosphate-dependent enzyme [Acinetobacter sp. AC1-2]MBI1448259.1 aminotransferase class III-fold pyridoxal phosphate-dependent enzyme [Acinetobacter sp. AC1-2]
MDKNHQQRNLFRSWSVQTGEESPIIVGGQGVWFFDEKGKKYFDLSSQRVNLNLGHQHPAMVDAIKKQTETLCSVSQVFVSEARIKAANLIAKHTPGDLNKILFTNSGTEAIENAIKISRIHTKKHKILSMYNSYHGSTAGAMSLTGDKRRLKNEPGIPGVIHFQGPNSYQSKFFSTSEAEETYRAIAHLSNIIEGEGPENIAAIFIEPIVGSNGGIVPPQGYLEQLRQLCDQHNILLVCDEVMMGFGRCGEWFSVNNWSVVPDLITFAKGVNSGYIPLGGVAISEKIAKTFETEYFPGGGTYYGHPLACASAVAAIEIMEKDNLISRAKFLGIEISNNQAKRWKENKLVGDVRGLGLFWVIELVKTKASREPFLNDSEEIKFLKAELLNEGISTLVLQNKIYFCPPLIIDDEELEFVSNKLDSILSIFEEKYYEY